VPGSCLLELDSLLLVPGSYRLVLGKLEPRGLGSWLLGQLGFYFGFCTLSR